MIINLPFTPKNTKKVRKAAEVIKNSLPGTPKSEARALINIINSQSPITKTNIITNTYSTSHNTQEIDLTLYNTLKRKRDRFSNCSRQLVMKAIADQDAKKAKTVFHHRRLKHLANYDSADILNHFKSGKTYKKDLGTQKKVIVRDFYEKDYMKGPTI